MRIRTTRQAQLIRAGVERALGPHRWTWRQDPPLTQRAFAVTIRRRNKPPTGMTGQLRQDHPERHASNESKWKVGDEIVTIHSEAGTVVIRKDLADRMGIQGRPGRVIE